MMEIIASVTGGIDGLFGNIADFDWELLFIWCLLMAIDIASGYVKACKSQKVSSVVMRSGIYKKMLDTFSILAILLMQGVVSYLGIGAPIGPILIGAFCFKELTSILENAANGLPKVVQNWLETVKSSVNDERRL